MEQEATSTIFKAGMLVKWSDSGHNQQLLSAYVREKYGEGPFEVVEVRKVIPSMPRILQFIGHHQFVTIQIPRGECEFPGSWFVPV